MTRPVFRLQFLPACMGGWCTLRERCHHYVLPASSVDPADRLCQRGQRDQFVPLLWDAAQQREARELRS